MMAKAAAAPTAELSAIQVEDLRNAGWSSARRPHEFRRHRLLGGGRRGPARRHGGDRVPAARQPHHLEDPRLDARARHPGRPGRGRDRHLQGPARPAPGASVLRPEGRGRALGRSSTTSSRTSKHVQVVLELDGSVLEPMVETSKTVAIAAGGEERVDWRVKVAARRSGRDPHEGATDADSDAAQMSFPAYVHGMLKMEAVAGALRPDETEATVVRPRPRGTPSRADEARSPVLADARRCARRRPALSGRLPLRLHRADAQPVPAHGHHPAGDHQPGGGS